MRATVLIPLVLLAPAPALAIGIGVDIATSIAEPHDPAFRSAIGEGATGAVETRLMGRVWQGLVIEAGYSRFDVEGSLRGTATTRLDTHGALLGLRWQQPLASWVDVHGRVDGLVRWGHLEVADPIVTLESDAMCFGAEVAAGFELHLPSTVFFDEPNDLQKDLALGVTIDAGYAWLSDLVFDDVSPGGVTGLGGVSLSTAVVRVGVVLWF